MILRRLRPAVSRMHANCAFRTTPAQLRRPRFRCLGPHRPAAEPTAAPSIIAPRDGTVDPPAPINAATGGPATDVPGGPAATQDDSAESAAPAAGQRPGAPSIAAPGDPAASIPGDPAATPSSPAAAPRRRRT